MSCQCPFDVRWRERFNEVNDKMSYYSAISFKAPVPASRRNLIFAAGNRNLDGTSMVTEFPSSPEEENQVTNIPIITDKLSFDRLI